MAGDPDDPCYECKESMSKTSDFQVICAGNSKKSFHMTCAAIKKSEYNSVTGNKNIMWICDQCINSNAKVSDNNLSYILNQCLSMVQKQEDMIKNLIGEIKDLKLGNDQMKKKFN